MAIASLLLLALTLSLDNGRIALGLGTLRPGPRRQLRIALVFGLWDGATPLLGMLVSHWLGGWLGSWTEWLAPVVLGTYGLVLIAQSRLGGGPDPLDERWVLCGLPLSLSLDNLVAVVGLGLLGYPVVVPAIIFGATTAAISLVALRAGGAVSRFVPSRPDRLAGEVMVAVATGIVVGWW